MGAGALIKFGKSLLDDALEAGYKTADDGLLPLRDSGIMVQAKAADGGLFDREAWIALNPRPEGTAAGNPEVSRWYGRLGKAKQRANKEGFDSVGIRVEGPSQGESDRLAKV